MIEKDVAPVVLKGDPETPAAVKVWKNGRGGGIRTHDLLDPKQARYQATLRPEPQINPPRIAVRRRSTVPRGQAVLDNLNQD